MSIKKGYWNSNALANPAMRSRDDSYSIVKLGNGESWDIDSAMTNIESSGSNKIHICTLNKDTYTDAAIDTLLENFGATLELTIDSSTFVITAILKNKDGTTLGTPQTIDLPLESVVVSGSYDNATKSLILTLENGNTITIPIADLISGLQEEITVDNKLDADLVDDSTSTNKFVTASDITNWNNHIASTNNPHSVTKAQVGLGNVDNTADLDKPISTATQSALDAKANNTNRVNGAPLSNSASVFYGTSSTAAATVEKEVSVPSITTLDAGTIIVVQPTVTSTVANSTIKLNNFSAYPMRYNNAAITTSTDSIVWNAAYPSVWVFDGTYWRFVAHGIDSNTTYSTMSVSEGTTGTATSNRVLQAVNLKQIIQGTTLTGIDVVTTGAVSATDTITEGIGKLQATKADTSVLATVATTGDYDDLINKPTIPTVNNPIITITQGGVTKGSFSLNQATGDTIALDAGGGGSVDIDNSTITKNGDDELQAVATINHNSAAGAVNPVYDWIGTLAEYQAQNIENQHPDWVCYITDDFAAQTYEAYTKTQANQLLDNKVGYCSFNENTKVQITASDQTATKNGWLIGVINFSGNNQQTTIYVNSIVVARGGWAGSLWMAASVQIPIKAGQTFRYDCTGTIQSNQMYFYPDD